MEFMMIMGGGLILLVLFVVATVVATVTGTVGSGIIEEEDAEED